MVVIHSQHLLPKGSSWGWLSSLFIRQPAPFLWTRQQRVFGASCSRPCARRGFSRWSSVVCWKISQIYIYIYTYIYMWEHHLQIGDFQIFEQAMLDYQIWLPNSTLSECASNIRGPEICVGRMHPEKKGHTHWNYPNISVFPKIWLS
jgi:hypothetical protein